MVVLSAAICTKNGKTLVSRQFVEMTRIRIEGLLAAFPKLLGSDSKQHTFVETESVRYLYQSMDTIYLLLITNRASNIIEDLETLRLLSKVVPDIAGAANNLSEEKISEKCFDLIFAFDEVITTGGYREPITLQQIRTNMEMESHEEKLHNMIKISKIESAKDQARDAARTIKERQKEQQKMGSNITGIGGGSYSGDSMPSSMSSAGSSIPFAEPRLDNIAANRPAASGAPPRVAIKGMSLATLGAGKAKSAEEALFKEDKLAPIAARTKAQSVDAAAAPVQPVVQQPIMLVVAERVSAKMSRDGHVGSFEIKGNLTLTANNDEAALCAVQMTVGSVEVFTFSTHPKVNKAVYDKSGLIQLKDATKGFPSARPVGILKWTHVSSTDDLLPIKVNCWPEEESRGQIIVSIEYTMDQPRLELIDVRIKIPLGTHESPNIISVDGSYKHSSSSQELVWEIPLIDRSNTTGSLEFTIAQKNADAFFPISVNFSSTQLICDLEVATVRTADGKAPILYGITKSMSAEEYEIE